MGLLELSLRSLQVILCIIHHVWLELPLTRTIFYGPKPVPAIEVLLYLTLFFSKIEKMSKNVSSAAVVIGALRVKRLIWCPKTELLFVNSSD